MKGDDDDDNGTFGKQTLTLIEFKSRPAKKYEGKLLKISNELKARKVPSGFSLGRGRLNFMLYGRGGGSKWTHLAKKAGGGEKEAQRAVKVGEIRQE